MWMSFTEGMMDMGQSGICFHLIYRENQKGRAYKRYGAKQDQPFLHYHCWFIWSSKQGRENLAYNLHWAVMLGQQGLQQVSSSHKLPKGQIWGFKGYKWSPG